MENSEVFNKLVEIMQTVMPHISISDMTMDSVLTTDLGIDSLNLMLLAITTEDTFNMRFETGTSLETVGDIVRYVEAHK